jgi:mono/diheme cytochrome c family protein
MLHKIDRVLAPLAWLVAAFAVAVLLIGPQLIGAEKAPATPEQTASTAADGKAIFTASCGGCHALADAGTSGASGPNLDDAQPDAATVKAYVRGGGGGMPAFGDNLSNAEIDAVAAYVESVAGGG